MGKQRTHIGKAAYPGWADFIPISNPNQSFTVKGFLA